jgi:DNA-binding NtrC family response regulator
MSPDHSASSREGALGRERGGGALLGELFLYHPRLGLRVAPLRRDRPIVVGRSAPSDAIFPEEGLLSGRHACFTADDRQVWVEDLGSRNGTWLADDRIDRKRRLRPGETVTLGGAVTAWLYPTTDPVAEAHALGGHEVFLDLVHAEIDRSRTFHHQLAIVFVRSEAAPDVLVPPWVSRVREHLRSVDSVALYGPNEVEILLPEASITYALTLAKGLVANAASRGTVVCGVASGPSPGTGAEDLVAMAHAASLTATPRSPVARHGDSPTPPVEAAHAAPVVVDPAMVEIYDQIGAIARSQLPVLIEGESGTGKEVVARAIHARSLRSQAPLRIIDCGALTPTLMPSELFGHERGSFTGAYNRTIGHFEDARGGTVFLDEIGNLPLDSQSMLLRALDSGVIQRVGSTADIRLDVRIIAATNGDLDAMAADGRFRSDLLFRLKGVRFRIPPLRERRGELRAMIDRFLDEANVRAHKSVRHIDPEVLQKLEEFSWPGNVRELKTEIERLVVVAPGDTITFELLRKDIRGQSTPSLPPRARGDRPLDVPSLDAQTEAFESTLLRAALGATADNQVRAAKLLLVPRRTFVDKLRRFGIKTGDPTLELPDAAEDGRPLDYAERVARFQRSRIEVELARVNGDEGEAARILDIDVRTLRKRLAVPARRSPNAQRAPPNEH